jgi:hypothetical protein
MWGLNDWGRVLVSSHDRGLAALPAILGALAGMVPALVQLFTLKANNAQQLAMATLQLQAQKEGVALQVDLANAQADVRQADAIYNFGNRLSGNKFVDALAVFVRPYITLVFFHLWMALEIFLFIYGVNSGYDLGQLVKLLWPAETQAMFGAIIGFWFGDRMMLRGNQRMAATLAVKGRLWLFRCPWESGWAAIDWRDADWHGRNRRLCRIYDGRWRRLCRLAFVAPGQARQHHRQGRA